MKLNIQKFLLAISHSLSPTFSHWISPTRPYTLDRFQFIPNICSSPFFLSVLILSTVLRKRFNKWLPFQWEPFVVTVTSHLCIILLMMLWETNGNEFIFDTAETIIPNNNTLLMLHSRYDFQSDSTSNLHSTQLTHTILWSVYIDVLNAHFQFIHRC